MFSDYAALLIVQKNFKCKDEQLNSLFVNVPLADDSVVFLTGRTCQKSFMLLTVLCRKSFNWLSLQYYVLVHHIDGQPTASLTQQPYKACTLSHTHTHTDTMLISKTYWTIESAFTMRGQQQNAHVCIYVTFCFAWLLLFVSQSTSTKPLIAAQPPDPAVRRCAFWFACKRKTRNRAHWIDYLNCSAGTTLFGSRVKKFTKLGLKHNTRHNGNTTNWTTYLIKLLRIVQRQLFATFQKLWSRTLVQTSQTHTLNYTSRLREKVTLI